MAFTAPRPTVPPPPDVPSPRDGPGVTTLTVTPSRARSGAVRVRACGEVDRSTAPGLRSALEQAIAAAARGPHTRPADPGGTSGTPPRVLVDLRAVVFCSLAGTALLERTHLAARRAGVDYLVLPGTVVGRLLDLTGLDRDLPVVGTVDAP